MEASKINKDRDDEFVGFGGMSHLDKIKPRGEGGKNLNVQETRDSQPLEKLLVSKR